MRGFYTNNLTANPAEYLTDQTGRWALYLLMASLTVTPLRRLTGWHPIIGLRRMIGLFAFFYATIHMLMWATLLSVSELEFMIEDVVLRPFITVGMATYLILFTLALTSNVWSIRLLKRRWQTLHRLVYVAGIGAVVHFWWLVKQDTTEPWRWALGLTLLLGIRVVWMLRKRVFPRASHGGAA